MKKVYILIVLSILFSGCVLIMMPGIGAKLSTDTQPPVLQIKSHTNNQEIGAFYTLGGTVSDNKSGVASVYVRCDNGKFNKANIHGENWYIDISVSNYGEHTNYIYARDNADNISQTNKLIVFRAYLPAISVTNLYDGYLTNAVSIGIAGKVSMDAPYSVTSVEISLNKSGYKPVNVSGSNWSTNLILIEGTNIVDIIAVGDNERTNFINDFVLIRDTVQPLITIITPTNNQVVGTNYTLSGNVNDQYGIKYLRVNLDSGAYSDLTVNAGAWLTNFVIGGGIHSNTIYAADLAGNVSTQSVSVIHYLPASIDPSFLSGTPETNPSNVVYCMALQSDGKILVGGDISNGILRLNPDGSIDTTFNNGGIGADSYVCSMELQNDGKILIGGNFSKFNGISRNHIARLYSDGLLDLSFDPGTGPDNRVYAIIVQPDGKILIGGGFGSYNGTTRDYLARLNDDGSLDTNFNLGIGGGVNCMIRRGDGNILIGGLFNSPKTNIVMITSNGTIDNSFDPGVGPNNRVYALALQSDGKILISGIFTTYRGTLTYYLARLNVDGSLDTGFNSSANHEIRSIALQNNGKIIIGGYFTSYDSVSMNHIARLNSDGSRDTNFNIGIGANTNVYTIVLQDDGRLLAGGAFTNYNASNANYVVRIYQ